MTNWDYEASRCAIGNLPGQHPPKESVNESPERRLLRAARDALQPG